MYSLIEIKYSLTLDTLVSTLHHKISYLSLLKRMIKFDSKCLYNQGDLPLP